MEYKMKFKMENEPINAEELIEFVMEENAEGIQEWIKDEVLDNNYDPCMLLENTQTFLLHSIKEVFDCTYVYTINHSLPGCMPDDDPILTRTLDEAKTALKDKLILFFNLDGLEPPSDEIKASIFDAFVHIEKAKNGPLDIQVENEHFWISYQSITD